MIPRLPAGGPIDGDSIAYFSEVPTFLRLPIDRSGHDADVAILGIPFDAGVTERAGAREGPRAVRVSSTTSRPNHGRLGSPYERLRVVDAGDVPCNPFFPEQARKHIRKTYSALRDRGCRVLAVGGDHSITLDLLSSLGATRPAVIHFDAHSDTSDVDFSSRINHATVFRRAAEANLFAPEASVQVGLHPDLHSDEDLDWARQSGYRILDLDSMRRLGPEATLKAIREKVEDRPVYITLDIDVLDPAFAPGTGCPEPGGMATADLRFLVAGLSELNLIGADLVEVAPCYDIRDQTSAVAGRLLFDLLCLF